MPITRAESGHLMFRCPKTGAEINSRLAADAAGLASVPSSATMRVRCPSCDESHEVKVAEGYIRAVVRPRPARPSPPAQPI